MVRGMWALWAPPVGDWVLMVQPWAGNHSSSEFSILRALLCSIVSFCSVAFSDLYTHTLTYTHTNFFHSEHWALGRVIEISHLFIARHSTVLLDTLTSWVFGHTDCWKSFWQKLTAALNIQFLEHNLMGAPCPFNKIIPEAFPLGPVTFSFHDIWSHL